MATRPSVFLTKEHSHMNAEICEILEMVMDDHGHPGNYSIEKHEDGTGGYEVIFASFNYLSDNAIYPFSIGIDEVSLEINVEYPIMVHEGKRIIICSALNSWNATLNEKNVKGHFILHDKDLAFHYVAPCKGGIDEDLIRGSVLQVAFIMDDYYEAFVTALFGEIITFNLS